MPLEIINVPITPELAARLRKRAARVGQQPEYLASLWLADAIQAKTRPEPEEDRTQLKMFEDG